MKICTLLVTTVSLTLCSFAGVQDEWTETSQKLTKVSSEFSVKERELRTAGEGSTELEAKARDAFAKFLQAMEDHAELKPYVDKQRALEADLETAIQENEDNNRQSAVFALQKLKGEQMAAALKIPEILKLKEAADSATQKAQEALVKSDPEAQALLAKRQKLLDRLSELSAKAGASE